MGTKISNQPGYCEKVEHVIDELLKAGLANTTDVVVTYDDTSKRVTVRCTRIKLKRDIARMFGYLDNTSIRASDKKNSPFPYTKLESIFLCLY